MRALWITERFPPDRGGAAVSALRQVQGLAPHLERLDVLRLTHELKVGRTDSTQFEGFTLHRVGRAVEADESMQLLLAAGRALVATAKPSVIHGFYAVPAGQVAAVLGHLTGVPSVVSLRGNDVDRSLFDGGKLSLLALALRLASRVLGVSAEIVESARLVVPRDCAYRVVHNGVDAAIFRPGAPLPDDVLALLEGAPRPFLAFTGELRLKKGLPLLLDLAEGLAAADLGTLVFIGGLRGGRREADRALAPLTPRGRARIREVPWSADASRLAAIYGAMDLFVFPALWEGMPNALLESMACERPSLATAVGGVTEVIEDGVSGFLLPRDQTGRLVPEALRLARDSERLATTGRAARTRASSAFTKERERDAILEVYRELS